MAEGKTYKTKLVALVCLSWRREDCRETGWRPSGEQFAVFRDLDGKVYVLDAYCPHLGANLAIGGRVVGSCIECPFHGWTFSGKDGSCTKIPYAKKVPEFAATKVWPSCEVNDMIIVWHHCDGTSPAWQVAEQEEASSPDWVLRAGTEHFVSAHIEEIPENAADAAHLSFVHSPSVMSGNDLCVTDNGCWAFFRHTWEAEWQPEPEPNGHCSVMLLTHRVLLFGKPIAFLDMHVTARQVRGPLLPGRGRCLTQAKDRIGYCGAELVASPKVGEKGKPYVIITLDWLVFLFNPYLVGIQSEVKNGLDGFLFSVQIGPGLVTMTLNNAFLGKGLIIQTVTPLEPLLQHVVHQIYCPRNIPSFMAKLILWAEGVQFERDVMIWNNKRFLSKPLLVKEDAAILRHRRWFSQFYSQNSRKLSAQKGQLGW